MPATLTLVPPVKSNAKLKRVVCIEAYTRQSLEDEPRKKVYNLIRLLNVAQQYEGKDMEIIQARLEISGLNLPDKALPTGTERNKDGYIRVKTVSGKWKRKHWVIWEL